MPSNSRSTNQYYGKYRECCVVAHLNNTEVEYYEDYNFSIEEKEKMFEESKLIASYIGDHTALYTGNHTSSESGDIILDNGETIEIKCVSAGTGTYYNTSIYYFEKFGFNFKEYMEKYGLYDVLENNFKDICKISRKNNSPVSQANSSKIRHNYEEIYNANIIPVDKEVRNNFIKDLIEYFSKNTDKLYQFVLDMLEKNTMTSKKTAPDRLIVLNYTKKIVKEINLKSFTENISTEIKTTDKGFIIGNVRIAIGWQNGNGLNNPTIRVFLEG